MPEAKAPEGERAVSFFSRLGELAHGQAAAIIAGALVTGLLVIAATQTSTTSFIADARTLNHAFVKAAEETIRQRLGFDARVSEMRLERSKTSLTLRARMLIAGGGVVDLQVNLNGQGAVEHTGLLQARDIRVPMDSVAGDVLQKAKAHETPPLPEQRSAWPKQFTLESIRVPFSIGHGQLVVHDAVLNGQLANAILRGKVDLRAQTINVGGTYLPMPSLAWVAMPTLLTGPYGDGLFGVTFAIQGPVVKPEVIVNPMWLIPPGMFRKIFEMEARENANPSVTRNH